MSYPHIQQIIAQRDPNEPIIADGSNGSSGREISLKRYPQSDRLLAAASENYMAGETLKTAASRQRSKLQDRITASQNSLGYSHPNWPARVLFVERGKKERQSHPREFEAWSRDLQSIQRLDASSQQAISALHGTGDYLLASAGFEPNHASKVAIVNMENWRASPNCPDKLGSFLARLKARLEPYVASRPGQSTCLPDRSINQANFVRRQDGRAVEQIMKQVESDYATNPSAAYPRLMSALANPNNLTAERYLPPSSITSGGTMTQIAGTIAELRSPVPQAFDLRSVRTGPSKSQSGNSSGKKSRAVRRLEFDGFGNYVGPSDTGYGAGYQGHPQPAQATYPSLGNQASNYSSGLPERYQDGGWIGNQGTYGPGYPASYGGWTQSFRADGSEGNMGPDGWVEEAAPVSGPAPEFPPSGYSPYGYSSYGNLPYGYPFGGSSGGGPSGGNTSGGGQGYCGYNGGQGY